MQESRTSYTPYHPRWFRRPVSTYWWLEKSAYFWFIVRELTCMFVAWFVVYLLILLNAVRNGAAEYDRFVAWSATPWVLTLNIVSFLFIVYHATTFFYAAPQAMVMHVGKSRVPGNLVLAGHFIAWGVVSLLVAWLFVGDRWF